VAHLFQFRDSKVVRYVNFVNTGAFVQAMKA
jgi:ketosteroid isomerase-like protein